jgi:protein-S-isoprenylcysteine O-methyltransferase Ste14
MSTAIIILSAAWLLSEIAVVFFLRSKQTDRKRDRSSLRIIWFVIILAIFGARAIERTGVGRVEGGADAMQAAGLILVAFGLIVRWIAILSLRSRFTVDVAITEGHRVLTGGIYRSVRHPAYLGSLLSFFGVGLFFVNAFSFFVIVIPVTAVFLYRIRIEESLLRETFGAEYQEYSRHTKRLFPGVY